MNSILDALYRAATEEHDLSRWLFDTFQAGEYRDCVRYAESQEEQLRSQLSAPALGTFEHLMDNLEDRRSLETHMLFNRGLAIGIHLGSMK